MSENKKVHFPQPDAPQVATTPLQVLEPNPMFPPSFAAKYGYASFAALSGIAGVAIYNALAKVPMNSGIQRYPIAAAVMAAGWYSVQKYRESEWAERDAIFRHYISLHPEDFPAYKRVKYADVFDKWAPIR